VVNRPPTTFDYGRPME